MDDFRSVTDALFPPDDGSKRRLLFDQSEMVFLGPKFEPWLTNDVVSRKRHTKLNNRLRRAICKHRARNRIIYVDCLVSLCKEEMSDVPGAACRGRTTPDGKYFDADGLHFNDEGYSLWKRIVEKKIAELSNS